MQTAFEEKKKKLLDQLKVLALKHNRDYYVSILPHIETATVDESDILDMYIEALDQDRNRLMQSRDAFVTREKVAAII